MQKRQGVLVPFLEQCERFDDARKEEKPPDDEMLIEKTDQRGSNAAEMVG